MNNWFGTSWSKMCKPVQRKLTSLERLKAICSKDLGLHPTKPFNEDTTKDDLQMDSLDDVELLFAVEDEFETEIPLHVWEECVTVGDILRLIE